MNVKYYMKKEWLIENYDKKNKRVSDLASVCGCKSITIYKWLQKFNISKSRGYDSYKNFDWLKKNIMLKMD